LYQPQLPHTVWGNFALLQRGQVLVDGALSFQAPAMWLRPFIFDFFFFGTGIAYSLLVRPKTSFEAIGGLTGSFGELPLQLIEH
jgi:hypothetical protein